MVYGYSTYQPLTVANSNARSRAIGHAPFVETVRSGRERFDAAIVEIPFNFEPRRDQASVSSHIQDHLRPEGVHSKMKCGVIDIVDDG